MVKAYKIYATGNYRASVLRKLERLELPYREVQDAERAAIIILANTQHEEEALNRFVAEHLRLAEAVAKIIKAGSVKATPASPAPKAARTRYRLFWKKS